MRSGRTKQKGEYSILTFISAKSSHFAILTSLTFTSSPLSHHPYLVTSMPPHCG